MLDILKLINSEIDLARKALKDYGVPPIERGWVPAVRQVLGYHGLPTTQGELIELQNSGVSLSPNCCIEDAVEVLWAYERLLRAAEKNDIKGALGELYSIMRDLRNISIYRRIESKSLPSSSKAFRQSQLTDCQDFQQLPWPQMVLDEAFEERVNRKEGNKGNGGRNKYTDEDKNNIWEFANHFKTSETAKKNITGWARMTYIELSKPMEDIEKSECPDKVKNLYDAIYNTRFKKGVLTVTKSRIIAILKEKTQKM